jgi:hypothetical protein
MENMTASYYPTDYLIEFPRLVRHLGSRLLPTIDRLEVCDRYEYRRVQYWNHRIEGLIHDAY